MSAVIYNPIEPIIDPRSYPQPISALSFDPVSDTLWAGRASGHVVAFHSACGMRGAVFPVGGNMPVTKIIAGETYIRALSQAGEGVGQWSKGGVNKWVQRTTSSTTAFSNPMSSSQNLCAATSSPELLFLNGVSGVVVRRTPASSIVEQLHYSHTVLLSGSVDGYLRTHDPRTGLRRDAAGTEASIQAHVAGVKGMQTNGNYVYTIGWGLRRGRPFPDSLVKIYDLRQLKTLSNIPFSTGPAFLNTIPRRSASTIVITSQEGLVNIVDSIKPDATEVFQVNASFLNSSAISPSGTYMAFGDADGTIHMMSSSTPNEDEELPSFNGFEGQRIEWADDAPPLPEMDWEPKTPLNTIGLPYYSTLLLSSWSPSFIPSGQTFCPAPQKIPAQVLSGMKFVNGIGYGSLPKEFRGRRNVTAAPKKVQARFRSGKMQRTESEDILNSESSIPKAYRKVEIAYSKFGVEDFDFAFYNKTGYSGLETHILNCYVNPVLQALHYSLPIRKVAKSHITTDCPSEHCLLCELGFVTRNLEDGKGSNCHAGNFCKTLGLLAQANNAMDLVEYGRDDLSKDYAALIQAFSRFLLDRLVSEWSHFPRNPRLLKSASLTAPAAAPITQLMGIHMQTINTCSICSASKERATMSNVVEMVYPRQPGPAFDTLLRDSIIREIGHKATCGTCKRAVPFSSRRSFAARDLPPVLVVHACVTSPDQLAMWRDQRKTSFLGPRVTIRGFKEGTEVEEDEVTYAVRSLVVQVITEKQSHLVSIVKVPEAEQANAATPWFVFNDFGVRNVSEQEALSFPDIWKVPAIVYLEREDIGDTLDFTSLPVRIDESILSRDTNIAIHRDPNLIKQQYLASDELPRPGTVVAIDAEFVLMQQEETEFRSDGSKKMLRPARLSLARVSVLRGGDHKQGVPFIDDHIHTSEMIVDNLTEFSGIKFGDLDPNLSRYTLTPLKTVYKKLRLLVDRGCIFIGHGLSKDFRMINIFVPPDQVLDTVDIYFQQSRQRRLSLKFLTWFVLKEQIQLETHDSIEDARSALRLWLAFLQFEGEGVWDQKLEELYREGKQYNFKPPAPPGAGTPGQQQGTATPVSSSTSGPMFGAVSSPLFGGSPGLLSPPSGSPLPAYGPFAPVFHPDLLRQALGAVPMHSLTPPMLSPQSQPQPPFFQPRPPGAFDSPNWRSRR